MGEKYMEEVSRDKVATGKPGGRSYYLIEEGTLVQTPKLEAQRMGVQRFQKLAPSAGGSLFAGKRADVQKSAVPGEVALIVGERRVQCVRNHSWVEMKDCLRPMTLSNFVGGVSRRQLLWRRDLVLNCQQELIQP